MTTPQPDAALAPSELALFWGERLKGLTPATTRFNAPKLPTLHGDEKVPASDLGMAVLAAAILANERAGALRLAQEERKALFGLRKTTVLTAAPAPTAPAWPPGTLEARVQELLAAPAAAGGALTVQEIVEKVLETRTEDGWQQAVTLVQRGLAARGLVGTASSKRLGIFTVERPILTEAGQRVADAQDPSPALALVTEAREARAEAWSLLAKGITKAVAAQTEARDDGMDFD